MTKKSSFDSSSTDCNQIVYVIGHDEPTRIALRSLFGSMELETRCFPGALDFLASEMPDTPSCLLLEVRLKGLSGFALQDEMRKRQIRAPIIFLTAHGDVPMSVRALKAGAFDFLCKPCSDQKLLETVSQALLTGAERLLAKRSMDILQKQYGSLTSRQREVMSWVAHGFMNKQIAHGMGVSEVTVKIHRMAAMKKMDAPGVPDLVRKALKLGVQAPEQAPQTFNSADAASADLAGLVFSTAYQS